MGARGPRSGAELAVVGAAGVVAVERPKPPPELTEEQQAEWRSIVNTNPADRFPRQTHAMLAAHCRHVVALRRVAQLIEQYEKDEGFMASEYDRLLKMQERESRCLASLAVRLGFAYSTAYEKRAPKKGASQRRPWEFGESDDE